MMHAQSRLVFQRQIARQRGVSLWSVRPRYRYQHGYSLLVVVMVLVIVSLLGLAATQIAIQGERAARNDRDRQIAHQAAEAALLDAAFDIEGASSVSGVIDRSALFAGVAGGFFVSGCGTGTATATSSKGLCAPSLTDYPDWAKVDLATNTDRTVAFGEFTKRSFPANMVGLAPSRLPRYVIESIPDYGASMDAAAMLAQAYRITAVGFGPRDSTYVVLQAVYRK